MQPIVVGVRRTCASDLDRIARLHRAQFADHLLGCLPEPLLIEFYRALSVDTIFLIAEIDGSIGGFVLGGEEVVLHRNRRVFMRSNRWRIIGAVIVHPSLWQHVWKRAVALGRTFGSANRFPSAASMRLLSIAVSEVSKGRGVAETLIQAFEASLVADVHYGLSVHADNMRAIGFYQKCGFVEEGRREGSVFYLKPTTGAPITATTIGSPEIDTAPPAVRGGSGIPG
jgi:ribosomal protein S18 acetylase RimI-like enzyme